MLVAGLSKQTIAPQDDELHFAHIRIQSCRHSYIYIMAPVRYNDSSQLQQFICISVDIS